VGNFIGTSVLKERPVSVIIEYMPILHNPDTLEERQRVETDSGLERCVLISSR